MWWGLWWRLWGLMLRMRIVLVISWISVNGSILTVSS
jgi:hypothetical protein